MSSQTAELVSNARDLAAEGRLDDAAEAYVVALGLEPHRLDAGLGLARIAISLSMAEQAKQLLDRTLSFAADNAEAQMLRGLVEEGSGHLDSSLAYYALAAQLDPRMYEARYHHGRALTAARRF